MIAVWLTSLNVKMRTMIVREEAATRCIVIKQGIPKKGNPILIATNCLWGRGYNNVQA
jgi:hypothetical protein